MLKGRRHNTTTLYCIVGLNDLLGGLGCMFLLMNLEGPVDGISRNLTALPTYIFIL